MKKTQRNLFFLLILVLLAGSACSASKKGNCGCPSKKGMIGY
jgi:hypothetical protein